MADTRTAFGYVLEMSCAQANSFPAFRVRLFNPAFAPKEHWYFIPEIQGNRELVWISLLRDAFASSLNVAIDYDTDSFEISNVGINSRLLSADIEQHVISGQVKDISVRNTTRVADGQEGYFSYATIVLEGHEDVELLLILTTNNKDARFAQLSALRKAFELHAEIAVAYWKTVFRYVSDTPINAIVEVSARAPVLTAHIASPVSRLAPVVPHSDPPIPH